MNLDVASLQTRFECRAVFTNAHRPVNSAQFSACGSHFITAADDDSLHIYNVAECRLEKTFVSRRFGARLVRFLHSGASTALDLRKTFNGNEIYAKLLDGKTKP